MNKIDLYILINSNTTIDKEYFLKLINVYFIVKFRENKFNIIIESFKENQKEDDIVKFGLTSFYKLNRKPGWLLFFGSGDTLHYNNIDVLLFTDQPCFKKCKYTINKYSMPLFPDLKKSIKHHTFKTIKRNLDYLFENNNILYYDRLKIS